MRYVNFTDDAGVKHHYGLNLCFYTDGRVKVTLVENKTKICEITRRCFKSQSFLSTCAYVDITNPWVERLLEEANIPATGETCMMGVLPYKEYDFKSLVKQYNREHRIHEMTSGMIQIDENRFISSALALYFYPKKDETYRLVSKNSFTYTVKKKYFIKAVQDYNIPVYKSYRKELYQ